MNATMVMPARETSSKAGLSQGYISAPTEAAKASFVAAAGYGYYSLPLQTVLSFFIGTFGYQLWCVPMYRSVFRRFTAFFGTVWCLVGLIGSAAPLFPSDATLGLFQLLCVPAVGLWFVMVGVQLYRYGQRIPTEMKWVADLFDGLQIERTDREPSYLPNLLGSLLYA